MTLPAPAAPALPPLAPRAWLRYDVVEPLVTRLGPATILELGCGQGAFGARLAGRAEYLGAEPDPDSAAVARARIEAHGGRVLQVDHRGLPPGSFDLVCAFEVLEHLEDDAGALAEWVRFVRPGGHLMLSVPAWPQRFGPMDVQAGHFRRYTPEQLLGLLRGAGLVDPQVTVYAWPLGFALEAVRNPLDRRRLASATSSVAERTAASGRRGQPRPLVGHGVAAAVWPFRLLQRLAPTRGTGLVGLARRT